MTVYTAYPGSQPDPEPPPPDRRMPAGWTPTPPTTSEKADRYRQLAAQDRAAAAQRREEGYSPRLVARLEDRARANEDKAETYDRLAVALAEQAAANRRSN